MRHGRSRFPTSPVGIRLRARREKFASSPWFRRRLTPRVSTTSESAGTAPPHGVPGLPAAPVRERRGSPPGLDVPPGAAASRSRRVPCSVMARKRELAEYEAKRDFAATPEPPARAAARRESRAERRAGAAFRRAGAPRPRAALGPAARARRRARVVGGAEGHPRRPEAQPPRGAAPRTTRSSTSRSRARSRRASTAAARWACGTPAPSRRTSGTTDEVMVTFHGERVHGKYVLFRTRRQAVDDPPHGSARGSRPRARRRTICGRCWRRSKTQTPPRRRLGVRAEVGRHPRASATSTADASGSSAATATTSRVATPSCAGSARRSARATSCSTARSSRSTSPAARASNCCSGACTSTSDSTIRRLVGEVPVTYVLFDLLWLDGHSTMDLPVHRAARAPARARAQRARRGRHRRTKKVTATTTIEVSKRFGLEGVVAKRLDSRYEPGRRSRAWLKVKNHSQPGVRRRRLAARREGSHRQHRFAAPRLLRRRRAALRGQGREWTVRAR